MTPFQNHPPASMLLAPRVTLTGDPSASVQGINTTAVADGALVYCLESVGTFRLDRADSTTPPNGTTVIAPSTGPGRWKAFGTGGASTVGSWQAYTPTLGGTDAALGNGSVAGLWRESGPDSIDVQIRFIMGTTSVMATDALTLGIPAGKTMDLTKLLPNTLVPGNGLLAQSSSSNDDLAVRPVVNTVTDLVVLLVGTALWQQYVNNLQPWNWTTDDQLYLFATVPIVVP